MSGTEDNLLANVCEVCTSASQAVVNAKHNFMGLRMRADVGSHPTRLRARTVAATVPLSCTPLTIVVPAHAGAQLAGYSTLLARSSRRCEQPYPTETQDLCPAYANVIPAVDRFSLALFGTVGNVEVHNALLFLETSTRASL